LVPGKIAQNIACASGASFDRLLFFHRRLLSPWEIHMPLLKFFRPLLFCLPLALMLGCGSVSNKQSSKSGPGPGMTPTPSPTPTPMAANQVELKARADAVVNGAQIELRGQFEREPEETKLEGELDDMNLPVGSAVSFCLVQGISTIPLAVGIIQEEDERKAEFELRSDEGQNPPNVQVGNILQARDGANGNMADCTRPLLLAATFVQDDNSGH
jgi:hypothetical protein